MDEDKIKNLIESARKDSLKELDIQGQIDNLGETIKITEIISILHKSSLDYTDKMIEKVIVSILEKPN
ncbi:TPA: hypothetical protein ACSPFS_001328 [Enterococcus faecium]|uniref:hypothetical protein n=1 Tax=Enterococcus TaxID=1350 RepID=UPI000A353C26|nr:MULTISPECIES: hypothetical protein [Enterococcus]EME7154640.1 hypothetical protein [Enterococcus faecium]MDQ8264858.1 hypothetical protein [Enterococcus faecium]MDQ8285758.1 hypothetical protein [Enterococcus faecium]MDQ8312728.1 hypothetical protein [Enterococcus faecium]MDQ8507288.1 hypothetical protein [Enterococcus faecium]